MARRVDGPRPILRLGATDRPDGTDRRTPGGTSSAAAWWCRDSTSRSVLGVLSERNGRRAHRRSTPMRTPSATTSRASETPRHRWPRVGERAGRSGGIAERPSASWPRMLRWIITLAAGHGDYPPRVRGPSAFARWRAISLCEASIGDIAATFKATGRFQPCLDLRSAELDTAVDDRCAACPHVKPASSSGPATREMLGEPPLVQPSLEGRQFRRQKSGPPARVGRAGSRKGGKRGPPTRSLRRWRCW